MDFQCQHGELKVDGGFPCIQLWRQVMVTGLQIDTTTTSLILQSSSISSGSKSFWRNRSGFADVPDDDENDTIGCISTTGTEQNILSRQLYAVAHQSKFNTMWRLLDMNENYNYPALQCGDS